MNRHGTEIMIRALAYFHRYGWLVITIATDMLFDFRFTLGVGLMCYAIWTMLGYWLKWRHICCSFQNAYHQPMTPGKADWKKIRKSDVYIVAGIFMVLGALLIILQIHPEWGHVNVRIWQ